MIVLEKMKDLVWKYLGQKMDNPDENLNPNVWWDLKSIYPGPMARYEKLFEKVTDGAKKNWTSREWKTKQEAVEIENKKKEAEKAETQKESYWTKLKKKAKTIWKD